MKALRGLHYVKRQPTGCVPARARVRVCVRVQERVWKNWQRGGEPHRAQSSCTSKHNHKEPGRGRREAEPWQEPEQYGRQLRQGALGAHEEPQALPTPFPLREGLWDGAGGEYPPTASLAHPRSPPTTHKCMNEWILAAPRCTTVPNGYQVSVTLLFLLLMPLFLSPLCVDVLSAVPECVCMRVHGCLYVWNTEPKGCMCYAQHRFAEQIYHLRHTLSRQIKSGVHVGCCCCSFLFGGLESRQRDIMLQRCFFSFQFHRLIPFFLVLPYARALPLLQWNC